MGTLSSTVDKNGSRPKVSVNGIQWWVQKRSWERSRWRETAKRAASAADRWSVANAYRAAGEASAKAENEERESLGLQEEQRLTNQNVGMQGRPRCWRGPGYKNAAKCSGGPAGVGWQCGASRMPGPRW